MGILTEGQLATVAESMARVSRAERYLENTIGTLHGCKVFVDDDSLDNLRFHLDKMHGKLSARVLKHIDAIQGVGQ